MRKLAYDIYATNNVHTAYVFTRSDQLCISERNSFKALVSLSGCHYQLVSIESQGCR